MEIWNTENKPKTNTPRVKSKMISLFFKLKAMIFSSILTLILFKPKVKYKYKDYLKNSLRCA
ncbi:hypothetical protein D3C86_954510 [compost metagenome]